MESENMLDTFRLTEKNLIRWGRGLVFLRCRTKCTGPSKKNKRNPFPERNKALSAQPPMERARLFPSLTNQTKTIIILNVYMLLFIAIYVTYIPG